MAAAEHEEQLCTTLTLVRDGLPDAQLRLHGSLTLATLREAIFQQFGDVELLDVNSDLCGSILLSSLGVHHGGSSNVNVNSSKRSLGV